MSEIFMESNIDVGSFVRSLCIKNNEQEIINLIKEIDIEMSDWNFTEDLYNYFKNELQKKELEEVR
jgi:hypothetical protein